MKNLRWKFTSDISSWNREWREWGWGAVTSNVLLKAWWYIWIIWIYTEQPVQSDINCVWPIDPESAKNICLMPSPMEARLVIYETRGLCQCPLLACALNLKGKEQNTASTFSVFLSTVTIFAIHAHWWFTTTETVITASWLLSKLWMRSLTCQQ